jgi:hypothetical protein
MDSLIDIFGSWNKYLIPLGPQITPIMGAFLVVVIFDLLYIRTKKN